MKCIHCQKEISKSNLQISAEIPSRRGNHYVACSCGFVMIGSMANGEIKHIEATPSKDTKRTYEMIQEAAELFGQVGKKPTHVGMSSPEGRRPLDEVLSKKAMEKAMEAEKEPATEAAEAAADKASECNEMCGKCNCHEEPARSDVVININFRERVIGFFKKLLSK